MTHRPLIIVGNGEIAAMAFEYFEHDSPRDIAAFTIDEKYITESNFCGRPVTPLDKMELLYPVSEYDVFVAIGDSQLNRIRRRHFDMVKSSGYALASYVSTKAFVWHNVEIGENCFILENNVLQSFVQVEDNVTLWSGNHIGHRSTISENVFMSSHVVLSGFCSVGANSFVGVNAAVANGVRIAEDNYIGMGAVITANTEPDRIYQGNPAEPRKITAKRFCRVAH